MEPQSPVERLKDVAEQLREGKSVPPLTVREFLSWFSAKRRGFWVVQGIREALDEAQLNTLPDFEASYIDSQVLFALRLEDKVEPESETAPDSTPVPPSVDVASAPSLTSASYADPTYRISKLAAANNPPVSINPNGSLQEAITKMLINDFSQLPVMSNERTVKGVVSWSSIGARLALGRTGVDVREFMEAPQEIKADASLFQAIPIIVAHQYVLIRGSDEKITGIVTASDLSLQFQQLAEPFLLLGEIENHIRRILDGKFTPDELGTVRDPNDSGREVRSVSDLTFGEYIRLLENPVQWAQTKLAIDRGTFCKQLDGVRKIRNDVMHFDPDGIPLDDLEHLRGIAQFLQRLQGFGLT